MPVLFTNNASATLAASITNSATSITVTTGQGALFPTLSGANYFYATLTNSSNTLEIVKVTSRVSDVLTVVRGQEGTTATAYNASDKIELRATAAGLTNMAQLDAAQTFTGANTFSGTTTFSGTAAITGTLSSSSGTISGTWAGSPTFSGAVTFSNTISGSISGNAATATNASNTSSISNAVGSAYTWTGFQNFLSTASVGNNGQSGSAVYGNASGTNAAVLSFHRPGAYAINLGLDTDNIFRVGGWSDGANSIRFAVDSSGNITARGNVTAYGSPSDISLKENITPLTGVGDKLAQLGAYRYNYKGKADTLIGVIAQEVEKVFPELVYEFTNETGTTKNKAVRYELFAPVLIEAFKDLSARVARLGG